MILRQEFSNHIEWLLNCSIYRDYAPNGLQVEGKQEIHRICTAVTASLAAIEEAVERQADALLVHHGYFWKGENATLTGMKRNRVSLLLNNNINLFAYHLPLDCHLQLGNNACIGEALALNHIQQVEAGGVDNLLWAGETAKALTVEQLQMLLAKTFKQQPLCIDAGARPINKLAWCSGGAQDYIEKAHALGADAYITGEISERTYYQAKELGIHFFACGHHATERLGIQALGRYLADEFSLEHHFIDSANPI